MKTNNIIPILISILPFGILIVVIWIVYKKFFVPTAGDKTVETVDKGAQEISVNNMSNGTTYGQTASNLFDLFFSSSFGGFFKDTDEDAVGRLLLTIQANEYPRLEQVYQQVKKSKMPFFTLSSGGTLTEDIYSTFSKSEKEKYLKHLNI